MTDQAAQPEEETSPAAKRHTHKGFYSFIFIVFLVVIGAIALLCYEMRENAAMTTQRLKELSSLQATVSELQSSLKNVNDSSTNVKQQLESLQAQQQRDEAGWHIAEAHYLVSLASEQLELSQNFLLAKAALQSAGDILAKMQNPELAKIRQSIASDIANLDAASVIDVSSVYVKLNALNKLVDQLELPATPLTPIENQDQQTPSGSIWDMRWQHFKDAMQKVVVVRQLSAGKEPLIMPEQKQFVVISLHLQLEQAMWAVLHRQDAVYQTSIERASSWVKAYFMSSPVTQSMLEQLTELAGLKFSISNPSLTETLQLFEQYQAQKPQSEPSVAN